MSQNEINLLVLLIGIGIFGLLVGILVYYQDQKHRRLHKPPLK
jgi:uncharacterized membrane protein YidH (DUF202 family)